MDFKDITSHDIACKVLEKDPSLSTTTDQMTIGLVEVPDDAKVIEVANKAKWISFLFNCDENGLCNIKIIDLPVNNNYTFLSTTRDLTEEVAKEICGYGGVELIHKTAEAALNTILTANCIDPSKNYAILEIKK